MVRLEVPNAKKIVMMIKRMVESKRGGCEIIGVSALPRT